MAILVIPELFTRGTGIQLPPRESSYSGNMARFYPILSNLCPLPLRANLDVRVTTSEERRQLWATQARYPALPSPPEPP